MQTRKVHVEDTKRVPFPKNVCDGTGVVASGSKTNGVAPHNGMSGPSGYAKFSACLFSRPHDMRIDLVFLTCLQRRAHGLFHRKGRGRGCLKMLLNAQHIWSFATNGRKQIRLDTAQPTVTIEQTDIPTHALERFGLLRHHGHASTKVTPSALKKRERQHHGETKRHRRSPTAESQRHNHTEQQQNTEHRKPQASQRRQGEHGRRHPCSQLRHPNAQHAHRTKCQSQSPLLAPLFLCHFQRSPPNLNRKSFSSLVS